MKLYRNTTKMAPKINAKSMKNQSKINEKSRLLQGYVLGEAVGAKSGARVDPFGDHFRIKIKKMYRKDHLKINAEKVLKK